MSECRCLGIELGSTRIKAVLIDGKGTVLATGVHDWENKLKGGIWTYDLDDAWAGMRDACAQIDLANISAIGVSAMMHGYLPFDAAGNQLTKFRTWRNTITEQAATRLTVALAFNIPQRWSIAHLYQAMLNGEGHVKDIDFLTTLAGYIHWKLTGERLLGAGEASGMFPLDSATCDYNEEMLHKLPDLPLRKILPRVLKAGEGAGFLTEEGARLLDPTGRLKPGIPLCPPEGDAGTGMVATNSVSVGTGNVSAGTSIFAMTVLEKLPAEVHTEIDMVTTPDGKPVAMVHCNNCTGELDAWVKLFAELLPEVPRSALYSKLYQAALGGRADGIVSYNYFAGEPVTGLAEGRPLLVRRPDSAFTLANFMRSLLFSSMATLRIGMDILGEKPEKLTGHGGFFKTPIVGQRLMASALGTSVSVMETAGEGGPWGMALLAAYMLQKAKGQTLGDFLETQVFAQAKSLTVGPSSEDEAEFEEYLNLYKKGLAVQRAAVEVI